MLYNFILLWYNYKHSQFGWMLTLNVKPTVKSLTQ